MHPNWKYRFRIFFRRTQTYTFLPFVTIVLGTIIAAYVTILFGGSPPWTPWKMLLICYGIACFGIYSYFILELLFRNHHIWDIVIDKQREVEKMNAVRLEQESWREKEREKMPYVYEIPAYLSLKEKKEGYDSINQHARDIVSEIQDIERNYTLTTEEKHMLLRTLPKDVLDILKMYHTLPKKLKNEQKKEVETFMLQKKEELEKQWKARFHQQLQFELQRKIKVANSRDK